MSDCSLLAVPKKHSLPQHNQGVLPSELVLPTRTPNLTQALSGEVR